MLTREILSHGKDRKGKRRTETKRRGKRERSIERGISKVYNSFLTQKATETPAPPPIPTKRKNKKADRHNESSLKVRKVNEKGNGERDPTRLTDSSLHKLLRNNLDCPFPASFVISSTKSVELLF